MGMNSVRNGIQIEFSQHMIRNCCFRPCKISFFIKNNSTFQRSGKGLSAGKGRDTTFVYDIYKSSLSVLKTVVLNFSLLREIWSIQADEKTHFQNFHPGWLFFNNIFLRPKQLLFPHLRRNRNGNLMISARLYTATAKRH